MTQSASSASSASHAHVAIVGAGPRGTSALERLCASAPEFVAPDKRLTIHVIDASPPGPGRIWRVAQPKELLMNTISSQITLFTDDTVPCKGPIIPGPSVYTWANEEAHIELGPNDFATRPQYGAYLAWLFADVVRRAPSNVDVQVHSALAVRLDDEADGRQTLGLSDGTTLAGVSAVILTQGHLPLLPDPQKLELTAYAKENNLRYLPAGNPADVDLSSIPAGEPVVLRGLGLNFFDYMALFTIGRGGRFVDSPEGMRYLASGQEPILYAGSRRGLPYHCRPKNVMGIFGRYRPIILTKDIIDGFRERANAGQAPDFLSEVWPLFAKEVETVYYEAVLGKKATGFRERFLALPHQDPEEKQLLDEFGIPKAQHWSWSRLERPYGKRTFESAGAWQEWLLDYLREDVKQAELGNIEGPFGAALAVMRDLRNEIRLIFDHGGLSGISRRDHVDRWFSPLNAFLSIGPPRLRVQQMVALMEAGVLHVFGPRLKVQSEDKAWLAYSPDVEGSKVRATTLIEARIPEPSLRRTGDELLTHLLKTNQCRPHTIDDYETSALDVSVSPYHLIDGRGTAHPRRFAIGTPVEGVHWATTVGPRPGSNSVALADSDAVAREALHVATAV